MSVQSEITRLQNAKTALKTAIESKGVYVAEGSRLSDYAQMVNRISTGITRANLSDFSSLYRIFNEDGELTNGVDFNINTNDGGYIEFNKPQSTVYIEYYNNNSDLVNVEFDC